MKNFWRGVAMVLLYVIGGALLIYAASRSLDFISSTLPGNQQIVGFLGLAATSGGMIAWLMLFMFHSEGLVRSHGRPDGCDRYGRRVRTLHDGYAIQKRTVRNDRKPDTG